MNKTRCDYRIPGPPEKEVIVMIVMMLFMSLAEGEV